MKDVLAAWKRVMELVEQGDGYERREEDDHVVYDWGSRRLKHTIYEPLDEKDAKAFESDVHKLPPSLRELLTECCDGAELLSGDVVIFGVSQSDPTARGPSFIEDSKSGEVSAFIGTAGDRNEALYLGEDGRLVLGPDDAEWPSLGEFLVTVLEDGLERCWDDDGRRVEKLKLGEPPPELDDDVTLKVPKTHAKRLDALRAALKDAPKEVKAAGTRFGLFTPDKLGKMQVGHRVDPRGRDLTGRGDGDWQPTWIVIGSDEDIGDPLFVDVADDALPVFTAAHGQGEWDPEEVAGALADLGD